MALYAAGNSGLNPAQDGTDATGVSVPAGAGGIRGWLSGIYKAVTGTLTVAPAGFTLVSHSISSTVASASTSLVAANAARKLLRVMAPQGAGLWLNLLGGTAGQSLSDCVYVPPGALYESRDTNAVTYWCGTAALVIPAFEG